MLATTEDAATETDVWTAAGAEVGTEPEYMDDSVAVAAVKALLRVDFFTQGMLREWICLLKYADFA